ncbi:unnamed protein product [Polarella glacialis]|uniref:Uncharacterized protein n=1 Tax=Polarella glacialis TaxID=89957 RepID=A0A813DPI1_POLGL|nr:unnamed protein product [Polarella glacialis]CAE8632565.1 unnamed protein product [Polarella glacialis]
MGMGMGGMNRGAMMGAGGMNRPGMMGGGMMGGCRPAGAMMGGGMGMGGMKGGMGMTGAGGGAWAGQGEWSSDTVDTTWQAAGSAGSTGYEASAVEEQPAEGDSVLGGEREITSADFFNMFNDDLAGLSDNAAGS